ncbi:GspH/FimT family pseudopilin [Litchfieldella rifensis]|uniref:Type II secretion system protein H n=1 Tax=Litchfieldella rifensis TaxID=762643 RepID=A0ABV7LPM7_9GAMM
MPYHLQHNRPGCACGRSTRLSARRSCGFTLIELLVVVAVAFIMASWAIPGLQAFTARHQVTTEVLRLRTALAQARNTAVARRTTITVCPSQDRETCLADWSAPLLIIEGRAAGGTRKANEPILKVLDAGEVESVNFRNDYRVIRFPASGWPRGYNGTFTICGKHGRAAQVVMSNLGRVRQEGATGCQTP